MSLPLRTLDGVPAPTTPRNRDPFATRTQRSLWIASIATASLSLMLVSVFFNPSKAYVLAGIIGVGLLAALAIYSGIAHKYRSLDPFSPYLIFPIAYIVWFSAGSIDFIQIPPDLAGFGTTPFDPMPSWIYGAYALGLTAYFIGLVAGRLLPTGDSRESGPEVDIVKMQRIVHLTLFGTVLFWIITQLQFGLPVLRLDQSALTRLEIHGAFFQIFIALSWTSFVFSPVYVWIRGGKSQTDWFWLYCVPFIVFLLLLSLGARSRAAVPLLVLLIARCYLRQKPTWKLFLGGALIFFLFSEYGFYRDDSSWDQLFLTSVGLPAPMVPLVFSALYVRYTVDALRSLIPMFPQHMPFQHGAMTLAPFKALLPGHQDMSDIFFKKILGRDFEGSGQPATLLAPLYVDFGWPGIAAGMISYGMLLSWTFRRIRTRWNVAAVLTYSWWMQATIMGLYSNGYAYIIVFIMPLLWFVLLHLAKPQAAFMPHTTRRMTRERIENPSAIKPQ